MARNWNFGVSDGCRRIPYTGQQQGGRDVTQTFHTTDQSIQKSEGFKAPRKSSDH